VGNSNGAVGDSHVTKQLKYHGTGTNDCVGVILHRTWRGQIRGAEPIYNSGSSEIPAGPFTVVDVRWDGKTTAQAQYVSNPTWGTVLTGNGYTDYASTTDTNRRTLSDTSYDDLGRPFRWNQYSIDLMNGAKGDALRTDMFYDLNGRVVASGDLAGGTSTEIAYDAAGRQYQSRTVLELSSSKFSSGLFNYRAPAPHPDLSSMSSGDDLVITLSHSQFDDAGNTTGQHAFDMTHDDGTPGIDLSNNDDYVRSTTYSWFDDANRPVATANYGSGDTAMGPGTWKYAAIPARPGNPPVTANTVLVTSYGYDSEFGLPSTTTDPLGRSTKTFYDHFSRPVWAAENFDNFTPANLSTISDGGDSSKDRVTSTGYNGLGQKVTLTAYNGGSGNAQVTQYLYEDAVSATRLTSTIYPDSSDTDSSGTDQVKTAYHVDGLPSTRTDQRGTVLSYGYDPLRRNQSQKVTNLGGATDGAVLSITRSYDSLGRVAKITSHGNATDDPDNTSNVKNQIVYTRDGLGNILESEQSHSGVVSSSPSVQYGYDTTSGSGLFTNNARPTALTYPNGRVLFGDFGAADSLTDRISALLRLRETNISGTILAEYSRTGSGQVVITDYPVPDLKQDLFGGTSGTYAGLDRFGRTKDHRWYNYTSSPVDVARYLHGYDANSNRLWTDDTVAAANSVHQDELYTFDGLNRLTTTNRGDLTTNNTVIASKTFGQDYGLDQLNNWSTFDEDPDGSGMSLLNQTRDHNLANEITDIDSASTYVAHDAAGNMTTAPKPGSWNAGLTLTWDAWNRLVKVQDGVNTVAEYQYDGKNRRVVKSVYTVGSFDHDEHFYLSESDQVLEVRKDSASTAHKQFTWGSRYIDDLVLRTRDTDANGSMDETLYAIQDANWDVTALADASGTIVERLLYDPYGRNLVLDANFTADMDGKSDFDWEYRFTSREFDTETDLHYFRARYWHPDLGRFIGRDPLKYVDGSNLYAGYFVPNRLDPSGLSEKRDKYRDTPLDQIPFEDFDNKDNPQSPLPDNADDYPKGGPPHRKDDPILWPHDVDEMPKADGWEEPGKRGDCSCVFEPHHRMRPRSQGAWPFKAGDPEADCKAGTTILVKYQGKCVPTDPKKPCDCDSKSCWQYTAWICRNTNERGNPIPSNWVQFGDGSKNTKCQ